MSVDYILVCDFGFRLVISSVLLVCAEMSFWRLLQADCRGISFMGKTPDVDVGGSVATRKAEKTPSHEEDSLKEAEGSQGSPG
ncbi:hypothetical protein Hanom_Chr07g00605461 [Helianthus anomalus]